MQGSKPICTQPESEAMEAEMLDYMTEPFKQIFFFGQVKYKNKTKHDLRIF